MTAITLAPVPSTTMTSADASEILHHNLGTVLALLDVLEPSNSLDVLRHDAKALHAAAVSVIECDQPDELDSAISPTDPDDLSWVTVLLVLDLGVTLLSGWNEEPFEGSDEAREAFVFILRALRDTVKRRGLGRFDSEGGE